MKFAFKAGVATVTTAGTRVALSSSSRWVRGLRLVAPAANSGLVFVGDVTVTAAIGHPLAASEKLPFSDLMGLSKSGDMPAVNLNSVYVDAATNGDKLAYAYVEEIY